MGNNYHWKEIAPHAVRNAGVTGIDLENRHESWRRRMRKLRNHFMPSVPRSAKGWYFMLAMVRAEWECQFWWNPDKNFTLDESQRIWAYADVIQDIASQLVTERPEIIRAATSKALARLPQSALSKVYRRILPEITPPHYEYAAKVIEQNIEQMDTQTAKELLAYLLARITIEE